MSAISELYETKGCDPGLKLGLTPLYIAILTVIFSILVYGNCVVKIFQKTTDSGMSIGKILKMLNTKKWIQIVLMPLKKISLYS